MKNSMLTVGIHDKKNNNNDTALRVDWQNTIAPQVTWGYTAPAYTLK